MEEVGYKGGEVTHSDIRRKEKEYMARRRVRGGARLSGWGRWMVVHIHIHQH